MRNDIQRALSGAPVAAPMLADGYGAGTRRMGSTATQVAGRTAGIPPYRYGPEDGGPDGPPQRQRRVWPWVVLATVVVVLIAAIVLIKYVTGNSGGVAVPNVINSPLTAAEQSITSVGLKVGTVTAKQSASVTKDLVISTNPAFGSNEPKGSPVSIVYSIGPKPVATKLVPPVVGETRGPAISALRKAGFQVAVIAGQSPTAPANTVISQTPSGNTSQPVGSTVTISVTGATVTVPTSVLGMTQAQAQSLLSSAPYNYNVTVQPGAGNGAVGTVYQTSPPVGTALPSGSAITIFVVAPQVTAPPTSPSSTPSSTPSGTASP
jgi:beta-lactam-binding protein with PASTA domain